MKPHPKASQLGRDAAALAGAALTVVFGAMARIRRTPKPLHPRGELHTATVVRTDGSEPVGVPWIDEPGTDVVQIRLSRATGLPPSLPVIHGLALRIPVGADYADVLFATTGLGRVSRFVLLASRYPMRRAYSTLIPYRTDSGPLLLAAIPEGEPEQSFTLAYARISGAWHEFAHVVIASGQIDVPSGDTLSFDPVVNQLPGLLYYAWAATLREGAYRAARRSRGDASVSVD